jgi:hypothetical protein
VARLDRPPAAWTGALAALYTGTGLGQLDDRPFAVQEGAIESNEGNEVAHLTLDERLDLRILLGEGGVEALVLCEESMQVVVSPQSMSEWGSDETRREGRNGRKESRTHEVLGDGDRGRHFDGGGEGAGEE